MEIVPVTFSEHARERLLERHGAPPDNALARHIGNGFQLAPLLHQPPIRGPAEFRIVELPGTSSYALCAMESGQLMVYTVLTDLQVLRSFASGVWSSSPVFFRGDDDAYLVSWHGKGGAVRIQGCRSINDVRALVQKLVDADHPEDDIDIWSRDQNIKIRTRRIVALER
jgi:hypothetical protein